MSDHLINDKYPWLFRLAFAYKQLSESLVYTTPNPSAFVPIVIDKLGYDFTASLQSGERPDMSFILDTGLAAIIRNHHALNSMMYNDMILRTHNTQDGYDTTPEDPALFAETLAIFKEAKMRHLVEEDKHVRFDLNGLRLIADKIKRLLYTGVKVDSRQLYETLIYNPYQLSCMISRAFSKPVHSRYNYLVGVIDEARLFLELGLYLYMLGRGIDLDGVVDHYLGVASTYSHNVIFTPAVSSMTIAAALLPMYETSLFMERHARIFNRQQISLPEATLINQEGMRYVNVFYGHTE